ncbi:major head protein [Salmonella phage SeKF_80]
MADTTLVSYDLNGKKLSFANWISNLSPDETPFVSMTGKESIAQTLFQWQTDALEAAVDNNAVVEGSQAEAPIRKTTLTLNNVTQILRKVVKVSDTSQSLANYGRGNELKYQMEKAGKEIKRDLEVIFLSDQDRVDGDATTTPRRTAAFQKLVADFEVADPDTGAIVHKAMAGETPTESEIFDITYNLYLSGSKANIIMFHPKFASFFSSLMEVSQSGNRVKLFDGEDTRYNKYVTEVVDPLGCTYKLVPNRWMPEKAIYFLSASDWTQMVLRAPERTKLAKDGSYEKWMLEMEVGLRHRHPYASGILLTASAAPADPVASITLNNTNFYGGISSAGRVLQIGAAGTADGVNATITTANVTILPATANQSFTATSSAPAVATVAIQGSQVKITAVSAGTATLTVTSVGDPTKTATATITVYDRTVSTDSFSPNTLYVGQTQTLGKSIDTTTPAPTWTYVTLDAAVATVNTSGLVTAVGSGFTRIRAIAAVNGIRFYDQSGLDVEPAVVVTATGGAASVAQGATVNLASAFSATPASAQTAGFTYASSNDTNASVDAAGVVTGNVSGTSATITATSKADTTKSATKVVNVT